MNVGSVVHSRGRLRGFTLIELLVTALIMGVLASVALPMYDLVTVRAKEQKLRVALREIRSALDDYKRASENGRIALSVGGSGYPPSLEALVEGVVDAKSPAGRKIYFLRRVPRDPFFPDTSVPAAKTWGLRSYLSEPAEPEPGEDVFDIYSRSEGIAFDGTAYRDWQCQATRVHADRTVDRDGDDRPVGRYRLSSVLFGNRQVARSGIAAGPLHHA